MENEIAEIVEFIQMEINYDLLPEDQDRNDLVRERFPDFPFNFRNCAQIDALLYPGNGYGGYWRAAYNWPQQGDMVWVPFEDGEEWPVRAVNVGFFTFGVVYEGMDEAEA